MRVVIDRMPDYGMSTIGKLYVVDNDVSIYECFTLELPWNDNQPNISCIPKGTYNVVKRHSKRFKNHFHILDVPGRSYILIHTANYVSQLLGCVAVGKDLADINGDDDLDLTQSQQTLNDLLDILPSSFSLQVL